MLFFIADWHSLTTHPPSGDVTANVRKILSEYLACGIDPEKAAIYVQSDVKRSTGTIPLPEHERLFGRIAAGDFFQGKARKQPENVNAGLLTYPTLMAADILIHRADKVPVGKDQGAEYGDGRKFARRFNTIYGVEFSRSHSPIPSGGDAIKVPGLDGSGKMGKSEGNAIYLIDDAVLSVRK